MKTEDYLAEYYSQDKEDGRLESKCGSVEFITSMRYIEKYIKPGDRVLDVGPGTGRYSLALAGKGYSVDAVELIEHNINIFQQKIKLGDNITLIQGNATDLSKFSDNSYDIVLIFGPMYHLFTKKDKLIALNEAIRVTKQGGLIFIAYCIADPSILNSGFRYKTFNIFDFIENGYINPETFSTHSEPKLLFELVRKEDIDELNAQLPVTRLHYVATDGFAFHMRNDIDDMCDDYYNLFLKYHFATCEREDMVGLSAHTLDILKKD